MNMEHGFRPKMEMPKAPKKRVEVVDNRNRIPELPDGALEALDDEAVVSLSEGGSKEKADLRNLDIKLVQQQKEIGDEEKKAMDAVKEKRLQKNRENAVTLIQKKLELGMDPEELHDMITGQIEEIDDTLESLDDSQSVLRDDANAKRESLLAQLSTVEQFKKAA